MENGTGATGRNYRAPKDMTEADRYHASGIGMYNDQIPTALPYPYSLTVMERIVQHVRLIGQEVQETIPKMANWNRNKIDRSYSKRSCPSRPDLKTIRIIILEQDE